MVPPAGIPLPATAHAAWCPELFYLLDAGFRRTHKKYSVNTQAYAAPKHYRNTNENKDEIIHR